MANIKPHKIILEFDSDGAFDRAICMYRKILDNGSEDVKFRTITINSEVNATQMETFLQKVKTFVKNNAGD
jgi:hypothetical protein